MDGTRPLQGQYTFAVYSEYEFLINIAKLFESRTEARKCFLRHANAKNPAILAGFFAFARRTGLEPATSHVTGGCSNQLSYHRKYFPIHTLYR